LLTTFKVIVKTVGLLFVNSVKV